ncbi:unnamed protein product [Vitrella brassicaformis CCMP3155]|uniref:PUA domain-containing protein n=1 Tax=Vitrella brassicaformis (strain CCMP3155) TaxID=1169540 RepID=A0A0G4EK07_VITBC|nr:unnamed protein product [Vitrella brassicaformis CCMP3155]|eukprot:CEL96877.1 unnamed protein product [Vitrella brassicaformis CCMP3155]
MFKRFSYSDVSTQNQVKSSVQRKIRTDLLEQFPRLDPVIDDILPKKSPLVIAKCPNQIQVVLVNSVPVCVQSRDGPWVPTLRLLHQHPSMMPKMQADKGATKFIMGGANVMCPGLTHPTGGRMEDVDRGAVVQILLEGREHACAVGIMTMSTAEIRKENKGVCIEVVHVLNDGLWKTNHFG